MTTAPRPIVDMTDLDPALVENDHFDRGHVDIFVEGCPICCPEMIVTVPQVDAKGRSKATGRKNIDHSACSHPRTKAGRADCRKATAQVMIEISKLDVHS